MEKDVGEGLPDAQAVNDGVGDEAEGLGDEVIGLFAAEENVGESLRQKNSGADEDEELDAGGDETAPIEIVAARTELRRHSRSVRLRRWRRQSGVSSVEKRRAREWRKREGDAGHACA